MPDQQRICGETGHWNKTYYRQLCQDGKFSEYGALQVDNFIGRLLLTLTTPPEAGEDVGWIVPESHAPRRLCGDVMPARSAQASAKFFDNSVTSAMAAGGIKRRTLTPMHA